MVGSDFVVVAPPFLDDGPGVRDAVEPVLVEAFVAQLAVEALHVAVLLRLARLDEGVLHAVHVAPAIQGQTRELGPVVGVDPPGPASEIDKVVEDPGYAMAGYRAVDLDPKAFLGVVVHDREHPHSEALPCGVVHEVQAPSLIGGGRLEDLLDALEAMPLALAAANLESRVTVYPIHPLQVNLMAFAANQHMQSAVAPALALRRLGLEELQQCGVIAARPVAVGASGHADQPAGATKPEASALAKMVDRSTLLYGLDQFFELISFKASMPSIWSATMRLSLAFSPSNSFIRRSC